MRTGPAPPEGIASLRRLVIERMLPMPGYWMRLENRTGTKLSGSLRLGGAGFTRSEVEAPGACACLSWGEEGSIAFEAPAGARPRASHSCR